jgi:hypothetical protein
MIPVKKTFFAERVDVAPDGLRGYVKLPGKGFDGDKPLSADQVDNLFMAASDCFRFSVFHSSFRF